MVNQHIISMPDKWEYPWYAAWDLAFHTIALSTVDEDFAKEQLDSDAAGVLPASRPVRSRPTNGTSATLIRRYTRGQRFSCTVRSRPLREKATSIFLSGRLRS